MSSMHRDCRFGMVGDSSWVHDKCRGNMQLLPVCVINLHVHIAVYVWILVACMQVDDSTASIVYIMLASLTPLHTLYPGIGPSELHTHTDGGR